MHLTPRQWFWYLVVAAAVFAFLGRGPEATAGGHEQPSYFRRGEWLVWYPVDLLLVPGRFAFSRMQFAAVASVHHFTEARTDQATADALREQIRYLENVVDYQNGQLQDLNARLAEIHSMKPRGLTEKDLLPANIIGFQAGPGAAAVTLDKGSADGVQRDMVVIAKLSPIGRVTAVGPKTCAVRLLTDPENRGVLARIVRKSDASDDLIASGCLVTGAGDGQMRCDSISVTDTPIPPAPGDRVQLVDSSWPPKTQYMILGDVIAVGRNDRQLLRYSVTIAPRVNPAGVQSTLIVLHGD
jgi:rod shape-determining protein MreC